MLYTSTNFFSFVMLFAIATVSGRVFEVRGNDFSRSYFCDRPAFILRDITLVMTCVKL